jgi:hypothetical protein
MSEPFSFPIISFPKKTHLEIATELIGEVYRKYDDHPDNLILDFSQCEEIDSDSLLFLIYFVQVRERRRHTTKISLPEDKRTRRSLERRQFGEAISRFTLKSFASFLADSPLKPTDTNKDPPDSELAPAVYSPRGLIDRLESAGFFAITSWLHAEASTERLILQLKAAADALDLRWSNPAIQSFIKSFLGIKWLYCLSHIDFCAVRFFFLQDTVTSFASTATLLLDKTDPGSETPAALKLSYRNDGRPIVQAFQETRKALGLGYFADLAKADCNFTLEYLPPLSFPKSAITAQDLPELLDHDIAWLLISLLPNAAVQRNADPTEFSGQPGGLAEWQNGRIDLNYLVNAASALSRRSSIELRSGSYLMRVERRSQADGTTKRPFFHVLIQNAPRLRPELPVNSLDIHIPLTPS